MFSPFKHAATIWGLSQGICFLLALVFTQEAAIFVTFFVLICGLPALIAFYFAGLAIMESPRTVKQKEIRSLVYNPLITYINGFVAAFLITEGDLDPWQFILLVPAIPAVATLLATFIVFRSFDE